MLRAILLAACCVGKCWPRRRDADFPIKSVNIGHYTSQELTTSLKPDPPFVRAAKLVLPLCGFMLLVFGVRVLACALREDGKTSEMQKQLIQDLGTHHTSGVLNKTPSVGAQLAATFTIPRVVLLSIALLAATACS